MNYPVMKLLLGQKKDEKTEVYSLLDQHMVVRIKLIPS